MAQRLKEEILLQICFAAAQAFATHGFERTRLADVAAAAGISTGNLYRYFPNKEALFEAVFPRAKAARFLRLLRARLRELAQAPSWSVEASQPSAQATELLRFMAQERLLVLTLLAGGTGSPLGHVRGRVTAYFEELSLRLMDSRSAPRPLPPFVLRQVFVATLDMIVEILRHCSSAEDIEAAFQAFWRYQLAGLEALLAERPSSSKQ